MFARDVSNYTVPITQYMLAAWKAEGVGLVIIQAFPSSYAQYSEQLDQMRACKQAELPFDCYIYDYLGDPTWRTACLDGLEQAEVVDDLWPRKLWLDEEDVETAGNWTPAERAIAVGASMLAAEGRGYVVGIYTGAWWWIPSTGDSHGFTNRGLWAAQYDGVADAKVFNPFGGWSSCRIKQYAGSQPDGTDLNVLSSGEEAEITVSCDTYTAAIERAVNRLQIELDKRTTTGHPKPLSRPIVAEIQSELFRALPQ